MPYIKYAILFCIVFWTVAAACIWGVAKQTGLFTESYASEMLVLDNMTRADLMKTFVDDTVEF